MITATKLLTRSRLECLKLRLRTERLKIGNRFESLYAPAVSIDNLREPLFKFFTCSRKSQTLPRSPSRRFTELKYFDFPAMTPSAQSISLLEVLTPAF